VKTSSSSWQMKTACKTEESVVSPNTPTEGVTRVLKARRTPLWHCLILGIPDNPYGYVLAAIDSRHCSLSLSKPVSGPRETSHHSIRLHLPAALQNPSTLDSMYCPTKDRNPSGESARLSKVSWISFRSL
jgi:hypothetical protein